MDTVSTNINSQVNELKHLTLSIDMSITNEISQKIIKITDSLSQQWQQDKILSTLVKMIRALSDYAASGKSVINKDISSLLHSIVVQVEYLSSSSGIKLPMSKKQAILSEEIAKYNKFKSHIKSSPREQVTNISYASNTLNVNNSPISELNSIILSLDWEITDDIINRLDRELNKLQSYWQNSKIHLSFLQMFKSIGSYVMSKGANTHPDAISLLNSMYKNFEHIVLSSNMPMDTQKEILMGEMKKFNDLKQLISSSKLAKPQQNLNISAPPSPPTSQHNVLHGGMSPMDDLIGTKNSSNLSPVDELIEEIHMLQDSGDRTHSMDRGSHGSQPTNPEVKEIVPNRLKKQPIPEIQTRLDAFFDEDEPLSDLSFADSGETVVPYKNDSITLSDYANTVLPPVETKKYQPDSKEFDEHEISFEDEDFIEDKLHKDKGDATSEKFIPSSDTMVPYEFDSEFIEQEYVDSVKVNPDIISNKIEAIAEIDINDIQYNEIPEALELIQELKSAVGKSMFSGGVKEIKEIGQKIEKLEKLWGKQSQKLLLLKMVKSLVEYFNLLAHASEEETFGLMLYIVESIEDNAEDSKNSKSQDVKSKNANQTKHVNIMDVFSRYIDFQNSILVKQPLASSNKDNYDRSTISTSDLTQKTETLKDKEILYGDRPSEEMLDIEKKLTEPKGLWGKIKRWLGF